MDIRPADARIACVTACSTAPHIVYMEILETPGTVVARPPAPAVALELQASMMRQEGFDAAAAALATGLARLFDAERVAIGMERRGHIDIVALSHGVSVAACGELAELIAEAMAEAVDQAATVGHPSLDAQPRITHAHAALAQKAGGAVFSVPLLHAGRLRGALTLERHGERVFDAADQAWCELLLACVAPVLLLLHDSERSLASHAAATLRHAGSRLRGEHGWRFPALLAASTLAAAGFCLVPVSNQIVAPVRLEGAIQRALTAPDDGYLQQVNARPGDLVKQGQVLAELAQQDLVLEQKRLEGELGQYEGAYGAALAQADRTALVSSQAKMNQARSRLETIARQIERARITAPFDGVVISGDLAQSLGAPVQRGNPLLVVAPSDRYRIIVDIDERDIADVASGASGRLRLTALPEQPISFSVLRIAPVAVTRDGRHFFEAEGRLDSASATLRPGLEGIARIDAPRRSLAGIVLRRLTGWLKLTLWSAGWWG